MMKKTYLSPVIAAKDAELLTMLNASITDVGGDSGIQPGEGTPPGSADTRLYIWDEEEIEVEE